MNTLTLRRPLLAGLLALTFGGWAAAEPPSRAARLAFTGGTVSFSPAGQPDWVRATPNRPLTTGDRLWTDNRSRAELQVGGAALRLGAATSVTLLNLDDRIAQVQLSEGTLKVRVRYLARGQIVEVDTPNLALTLRRPGDYRIEVDPGDDTTAVTVQNGEAEVYGEGAAYTVTPRQGYRFYGTGLSDYDVLTARRDDELDRWARERDRRAETSPTARYVSPDVVGYEDLDAYGTWRVDRDYGNVWTPTRVAADWSPYRDGHWAWVDPWGWTWVDQAPFGYAVSHYGRWAHINDRWCWIPGPRRERAVYAPALVAFVGGQNFQVSVSAGSREPAAVGWFPLAPREVYRPSYPVSRGYFDSINRSNAVIPPTTITNVYNSINVTRNTTIVNNTTNVTQVVYANQQVAGAVVAVPTQTFVRSEPVAKAAVAVSKEAAVSAPVVHVATVAPVQQSVHGGAPDATAKPPAQQRVVVARTAPPPPPVSFAAQQKELAAKPGTPIDEAKRTEMKPAVAAASAASPPKVNVVTVARAPAPTALPPATPPAAKSPEERKAEAARTAAARPEAGKTDAAQTAEAKAEAAKAETAKAEAAKADALKAEAAKAEAAKTAAAKAEAAKAETAKADAAKADAAKAETAKAAAAKTDAAKAETAKAEAAKADALKADAARAAAAKTETSKAETAKAEALKAEAAKAEAMKADAAKAAAAKAEIARADAAKADSAKAAAAKAEALKAEASKAEAAKAESTRADAAKAEAAKAAAAKAEASRGEAAKAEAAKAEAARAEVMKADAAKAAAAKAEAARAEATRAEAARAETAKAEAAKAAAARAEASKAEAARAEAARAEAAKAATAKAEASKAEAARAEAAKAATGKAEPAKGPPARDATAAPLSPTAHTPPPKREREVNADEEKKNAEEGKKR